MEKDLISVIVPAYNAEKYIENTIISIANQTYPYIEIICVDDGSTDSTLEVINRISERYPIVKAFNKTNEGVTLARKYGFEHASGEYVGFVDADDEIESNMYEVLITNLKRYNADISHCGHLVKMLDGTKKYFYNTGSLAEQDVISGIKSLISGSFEPGLCNKLYKYTLLHSLFHSGVMDYSIKINEDLLMNYYLFKSANKTVYNDVCLYNYIKRDGSASTSKLNRNHICDQIKVKQIILNDSYGTEYELAAKKVYLMTCIHQYNSIIRVGNNDFKEDKDIIKQIIKDNNRYFNLLSSKYRVLAKMIILCPNLYKMIYKLFA